jgi:hypothetical protein
MMDAKQRALCELKLGPLWRVIQRFDPAGELAWDSHGHRFVYGNGTMKERELDSADTRLTIRLPSAISDLELRVVESELAPHLEGDPLRREFVLGSSPSL